MCRESSDKWGWTRLEVFVEALKHLILIKFVVHFDHDAIMATPLLNAKKYYGRASKGKTASIKMAKSQNVASFSVGGGGSLMSV